MNVKWKILKTENFENNVWL